MLHSNFSETSICLKTGSGTSLLDKSSHAWPQEGEAREDVWHAGHPQGGAAMSYCMKDTAQLHIIAWLFPSANLLFCCLLQETNNYASILCLCLISQYLLES